MNPELTADDLELLNRPLHAMLTVRPHPSRWPAPRPVWFDVADGGRLQMFSVVGTPRLARLREDPRASVVVAAPVGEPEHWVSIEGRIDHHEEGARELMLRLIDRYYGADLEANRAAIRALHRSEVVRLVLHPERVQRYRI
jgi:hypothetical protein